MKDQFCAKSTSREFPFLYMNFSTLVQELGMQYLRGHSANYTAALGDSTSYYRIEGEPLIIYPNRDEDLTSTGVFISSLLLSIGGLLALTSEACRRSRCSKLDLCCIKCDREVIPAEADLPPLEMVVPRRSRGISSSNTEENV